MSIAQFLRNLPAAAGVALLFARGGDLRDALPSAATETPPETVVLIHGLGRSAFSMKGLEWALCRRGWRVINVSYPSTALSVEEAAQWLDIHLTGRVPVGRTHFVTHSLGGIVLRYYLAAYPHPNLGRVVMLAPPNQGSELAETLRGHFLFRWVCGPAGQQLGTGTASAPLQLGPARFELGVIAGDRSFNPLFSACLPGPDDGKVSVRSTRLKGMRDFLVVHHTHTWMMWRRDVIKATSRFLAQGSFAGG